MSQIWHFLVTIWSQIMDKLVQIYTRKGKNGVQALYLNYRKDGKRFRDSLGLYLYPNQTKQNKLTMEKAEVAKAQKILELQNHKLGIITPSDIKLVDWFAEYQKSHNPNWNRGLIGLIMEIEPDIKLKDVNTRYILRFLNHAKNIHVNQKTGKKLASGTIRNYYNQLNSIITYAYQCEMIVENPFNKIMQKDKPKFKSREVQYLTINQVDELNDHIQFTGRREQVRLAFLFQCYTGLRVSDVYSLTDTDIVVKNGRLYFNKNQGKTGNKLTVPLCVRAIGVLSRGNYNGGKVFDLPAKVTGYNKHLYKIGEVMGLSFKLHSHIGRHTFAMNALEVTRDVMTVKQLLGHQNLSNTLIYAKMTDDSILEEVEKL